MQIAFPIGPVQQRKDPCLFILYGCMISLISFVIWLQVLYALTAGIAGYVAAVTYKILGGSSWVRNTLLTATLFCGPLLVTFSFLNTVAIIYRSTAALPFGTIVIIFIIWAVVTFPLTVLGGIAGKNTKVQSSTQSPSSLAFCQSAVAIVSFSHAE